jgi:hypothetical protein
MAHPRIILGRVALALLGAAQAVVTAFGGGNGDPAAADAAVEDHDTK